jgi:ureidoglycolate lyase
MTRLKVEPLTPEAFKPYGVVLTKPDRNPDANREDLEAWINFSGLLGLEDQHPILTYLQCKRHSLPVNQLERHCKGAEAFIPLEGTSILIAAHVGNPNDPNDTPDLDTVKAFLLDGSAGVFLPRGSWHWAPFPVTATATFVLIMDSGISEDIEVRAVPTHTLELY